MQTRPIAALWQDYLFLTREMYKLLSDTPDMELFMELIAQRDSMQELLKQHPDGDYAFAPAGREILADIDREDKAICLRLQFLMNRLRNREKVNQSYDAIDVKFVGKRMDQAT